MVRLNQLQKIYTKIMKNKRKIKIYFSMDPDLHNEFDGHIDKHLLDKSRVIENLIELYMEKNKLLQTK